MARARRAADPERGRAARRHPRRGPARPSPRRCTREAFWDQLSEALADAQRGDGAGLLALYDDYYQRQPDGTWGNELEAFQTISCADDAERPTVAEEDATAAEFHERRPAVRARHRRAGTSARSSRRRSIRGSPITGAGAGPIVVIGTTGDPATPLDEHPGDGDDARGRRLVVVTADQHTGYGVNDCVDDIVHDYLIDLDVPPEETC